MGSLFDGIGGFPLAAIHNGIVPLWASEIEPFPIRVTMERLPGMLHYGDIEIAENYDLPVKKGLVGDFERMEEGDILSVEDALMGCAYIPRRSILYISTGGVRKGDAPIANPARKNARKK